MAVFNSLKQLFRGPDEEALADYTAVDTSRALSSAKRLEIQMKRAVSSELVGAYSAAFLGQGLSFSELREYQPGDDPRTIHWNVTARFGKPYVKLFREERQLRVVIVIDCSRSMCFEGRYDIAIELAALIATTCQKNRDHVGLALFSKNLENYFPPAGSRIHYRQLLYHLTKHKPLAEETDLNNSLSELTPKLPKRSVVFLLSDFEDENFNNSSDETLKQLRELHQHHQVSCIHLPGKADNSLTKVSGALRVSEAESESEQQLLPITPKKKSLFFKSRQENQWEQLSSELRSSGIGIVQYEHSASKTLESLSRLWQARKR